MNSVSNKGPIAKRVISDLRKQSKRKVVNLDEVLTNNRIKAIVPAGYLGEEGEVWYVRVLPEQFPELGYGYSVVFTTPYVIAEEDNSGLTFAKEYQRQRRR